MGKRWSLDEDNTLRDIAREKLVLLTQMHRLPGRTYYGSLKHANEIGISFRADNWSKREQATLRRIYKSPESIKHAVARLLPKRTYAAAKDEALRLGIAGKKDRPKSGYGYSALFKRIEAALDCARMATVEELATELDASLNGIYRALTNRRGDRVRVADWLRASNGGLVAAWALGSGPDAERPARKTPAQACREYRARERTRRGGFNPFAGLIQQVAA
jgi:hypothetical protein